MHKDGERTAATARERNVSALERECRGGFAPELRGAYVVRSSAVFVGASWLWGRRTLARLVEADWQILGTDSEWRLRRLLYLCERVNAASIVGLSGSRREDGGDTKKKDGAEVAGYSDHVGCWYFQGLKMSRD